MLGWIERVVPQPPGCSPVPAVVANSTPPAERAGEARPELAPKPSKLPKGSSASPTKAEGESKEASGAQDPVSTTESAGRDVLTWLIQGLEKVIPQPAQSPSRAVTLQAAAKSFEASVDIPDLTEVQSLKAEEEDDPEVSILGPEEDEPSDVQSSSDNNAPDKIGRKVFTWLREGFEKMMPQPESMKKTVEGMPEEPAAERANCKKNNRAMPERRDFPASPCRASGTKRGGSADSQSGLSVSLFPRTLGGDGGRMFGRFVQGLEKAMPQPATRTKQGGQSLEAAELGPGQERSKGA